MSKKNSKIPVRKIVSLFSVVLKNVFLVTLDVSVMLLVLGIAAFLVAYQKTKLPENLQTRQINQTSVIYDRTGTHILYEIHGEENRKVIPHNEIPNSIRIATIASEDDRFYSHNGIDPSSILRSLKNDLKSKNMSQGGSTITQQLARNVFLSREKTLRRKILEIIMALKIEKKYSKQNILDMYLNEVPYGSNAYGISAAAEVFFGKKARDLTLDEAALLAALPNAPTYFSPYGNHIDELITRQQYILDRISQLGLAGDNQIERAKKTLTLTKIIPFRETIDSPHFVFYVKEKLEELYGRDLVEKGGFKVYTTLDYNMQKQAEKIISQGIANVKRYGGENAALVALDPRTGQILAMVGSRDFFDPSIDGQVNVATRPRQPGSSFKPFAYAEAFEKGYEPQTLLIDASTDFGPDGSGRNYIPHNYDGKFHGTVSMRQALAMSLNIPAVKTLYLAGVDDTISLAHRMGITTLNKKNYYGLSLVLGGGEVTLLDETSGFGVFANDGKRNPVTSILRIETPNGKILFNPSPSDKQVLKAQIAREINSILSDNRARTPMFGSNSNLYIPGKNTAAKTGTSQEFRDAWTIGYTPDIVVGVWAGNNDNRPMRAGAAGTFVAAPIWKNFMLSLDNKYFANNFKNYNRESEKTLLAQRISQKSDAENKNKRSSGQKQIAYPPSVEFQNSSDPMILRWRRSLKLPENKPAKTKKDKK